MPVSITSNASARYAQSSLVKQNTSALNSTLKLSNGQRVLSAADDAAAMAIGTSLKIENSGLKAAMLNASSGVSMLQIADGALGQIGDLVTRLQTLAVQAASGQYDDATRTLMDREFQGLKLEVDRIAQVTEFNGVKVLAGTTDYTLGAGSDLATDGIMGIRFDQSMVTSDRSFRYTYDAATERLTLSRMDGGATVSQTLDITAVLDGSVGVGGDLQANQRLEVGFSQLGITMVLGAGFLRGTNLANPVNVATGGVTTVATPSFAVANANIPATTVDDLTGLSGYSVSTGLLDIPMIASGAGGTVILGAIPGISYKVGAGAIGASGAGSTDLVGAGTTVNVYVDAAAGGKTLLGTVTLGAVAATGAGTGTLSVDVGGGMITAQDSGDIAAVHLTYKVGTGVLVGEDTIGVDIAAMTLDSLNLSTLSISTQAGASSAIDALKLTLTVLNGSRASVGAQQTRLEAVGRNLGVISDNNESARSAMMDVDVSEEISTLTGNQAMMQASIAMLSRANQLPDMLLRLIQN